MANGGPHSSQSAGRTPPPRRTETQVIVCTAVVAKMAARSAPTMTQKQPLGQEQRLTFRVAVRPDAGVDAQLKLAGRSLAGEVGDVSAEGIFVKLERGLISALKIGSMVDVEVSFEGETLVLFGLIRSQHAGGYGVHFPERDPAGRANPLSRFGRISAQLQRSSLSQRLRVLKLHE